MQIQPPPRYRYLVHYNHDYHESMHSFPSRHQAVLHMAATLGIDTTEFPLGSPEFWLEIDDQYSNDDWKGLALYRLDLQTFAIEQLSQKPDPDDLPKPPPSRAFTLWIPRTWLVTREEQYSMLLKADSPEAVESLLWDDEHDRERECLQGLLDQGYDSAETDFTLDLSPWRFDYPARWRWRNGELI